MSRIRLLAFTTVFLAALTASAQQTTAAPGSAEKDHPAQHANMANADDHLKMLSEKLDLSADQQDKLRPIIQNMLDSSQKLMHDETLSSEQRDAKRRELHEKADREARKYLNDEQKKKLDELEAEHRAASVHAQH